MNFIECAQMVKEKGCCLIRLRKCKENMLEYDCKLFTQGSKRGWIYLDGFTASAVLNVYNALSDENKIKYSSLAANKAIDVAWKLLKKYKG